MELNSLYAILVLCARDVDKIFDGMRTSGDATGNPPFPAATGGDVGYLSAANWQTLGQLRCDDAFIVKGQNCYFGLLLKCLQDQAPFAAGDFMVAVRGTVEPLEWADDALSEVPTPARPSGSAGEGFWGVYTSMTLADMLGQGGQPAAQAVINEVSGQGGSTLWVTGHSLGATLATYLLYDLQGPATAANILLQPYVFASPRPGSQDYVDGFQAAVPRYDVVNYAGDLVPNLPTTPPFCTLNSGGATHNVHTIAQGSPGAPPRSLDPLTNLANNHSPVTYARMLDPANAIAAALPL